MYPQHKFLLRSVASNGLVVLYLLTSTLQNNANLFLKWLN